ncbi:hypothetical protein [Phyllobacterium sp. 22552]|uniref:hypothetical protein n=1 Tax=Phyllobacterium sp. 22552 TaxID=3453941 RepID=UPI003F846ECA
MMTGNSRDRVIDFIFDKLEQADMESIINPNYLVDRHGTATSLLDDIESKIVGFENGEVFYKKDDDMSDRSNWVTDGVGRDGKLSPKLAALHREIKRQIEELKRPLIRGVGKMDEREPQPKPRIRVKAAGRYRSS